LSTLYLAYQLDETGGSFQVYTNTAMNLPFLILKVRYPAKLYMYINLVSRPCTAFAAAEF